MTAPSYAEMFRVFGRIGVLSFGGPAAQIALMHRELVEERPWLNEDTYLRALSLCMLLPGPEAMQLATYAGWKLRGVPGGLLAGLLFVLPGAAVIATLVSLYTRFGDLPAVQAAFLGVKAAVIAIVAQALLKVARKSLTKTASWVIAGLAFVGIFAFDLPFPMIVALAAVWGYLTAGDPATPAQLQQSRPAPFPTIAFWAALWLVPLLTLSLIDAGLLAEIGWFFAWLAVVTFGGAYAVLGYMTQAVVQDFGWISTAQMIDALGLAETTPGPLILVTQFVAMLSGYLQGGWALALAAGLVALWATFVPCFLWIFAAGPYLDDIAARPRLSAALAGITAAVVGVILNLSIWFALHVVFTENVMFERWPLSMPAPVIGSISATALGLTGLAAVLIFVLRLGIAKTLAISAMAGLIAAAF